jgi:exonuclease SbcC
MRILSVALQNFKAYEEAVFEFEPGINAICGENGAGKTSILEAIAWVLFDYCPYNQEELIRTGANDAVATVQFVSKWDQRTYSVRRSVAQGYRLFDPQLKQRLDCERKDGCTGLAKATLGSAGGYRFSTAVCYNYRRAPGYIYSRLSQNKQRTKRSLRPYLEGRRIPAGC